MKLTDEETKILIQVVMKEIKQLSIYQDDNLRLKIFKSILRKIDEE